MQSRLWPIRFYHFLIINFPLKSLKFVSNVNRRPTCQIADVDFNIGKVFLHSSITGQNKVFLFDRSFLVLTESHRSSPIATKGFGGAVNPLFCLAFVGSFPHFSYKEAPDLQKINLFTIILFNIFPWKYRYALHSCSQHPWNPK